MHIFAIVQHLIHIQRGDSPHFPALLNNVVNVWCGFVHVLHILNVLVELFSPRGKFISTGISKVKTFTTGK